MKDFMERYREAVMKGFWVDEGVDQQFHAVLGLAGESGEVADLFKKSQYDHKPGLDDEATRNRVFEELGDTLHYLTFIAGTFGWSIEDLAWGNAYKLVGRLPNRWTPVVTGLGNGS